MRAPDEGIVVGERLAHAMTTMLSNDASSARARGVRASSASHTWRSWATIRRAHVAPRALQAARARRTHGAPDLGRDADRLSQVVDADPRPGALG